MTRSAIFRSYTTWGMVLALLLGSCGEKTSYQVKNARERKFIAGHGIVQVVGYENDCRDGKEMLSFKDTYDANGDNTVHESYLAKEVLVKSTQKYDNGLLIEKNYAANKNIPQTTVRYEYDENGVRTRYVVLDAKGNRISLHKTERKGHTEYVSDYDNKGKLTNYRTIMYDSLENPLIWETQKIRYSYNNQGLITEKASVDTLSGHFIRRVYEYRDLLPMKQTVYYNDTCRSVIRYEYLKASGEKW